MENEFFAEPIIIERVGTGLLDFKEFEKPYELNSYFFDNAVKEKGSPKLSIAVLSYNNLQTVQLCVECALAYTAGLDFELVLMDNASEDGNKTYDYFQSVPYKRKKIIQTKDNMGSYFSAARAWPVLWSHCAGDYILQLNDDHIVTENAIQNMIKALDSDPGIGMVNPKSSSSGMGQDPGLEFHNLEEMLEVGRRFNQYDPKKWEERIYVAAVAWMFRRELLNCFLCPNPYGPEQYYDFSIRREGYRTMLLGDTWVCHYHNYKEKETYGFFGESEEKKQQRQTIKALTKHYYYGLDFIEDICAFEHEMVAMIEPPGGVVSEAGGAAPCLLAVDVKAGQGLLDVKNRLRTFGIFETESAAYSTDARYYPILYTVADETYVDRIEYIYDHLTYRCFDYIIIGKPINLYNEPIDLLTDMLSRLCSGGTLLFKLRNVASVQTLVKMLGGVDDIDTDMPKVLTEDEVRGYMLSLGFEDINVSSKAYSLDEKVDELIDRVLQGTAAGDIDEYKARLATYDFLFAVTKP